MRRTTLLVVLVIAGLSLAAMPACGVVEIRHPFGKHFTYASGTLRPTNYSQAQQDNDVKAFYDYWKGQYVVDAGGAGATKQYRIAFGTRGGGDPNGDGTPDFDQTVSEGQGYGMIVATHMAGHDPNARTVFDGLYRFFKAHPSDIDGRLMGFLTPPRPNANNNAFDGDADIAYALLLADRQWGKGTSTGINYKQEALTLLGGVLGSTVGPQSRYPMLGDWLTYDVNGPKYNQYAPRTSDLMPAHFKAFQRATTGNVATAWGTVAANSEAAVTSLQARYSPATGLLPDFTSPESLPNCTDGNAATPCLLKPAPIVDGRYLEDAGDDDFDYNACRDPWRIAVDALVNNDAEARTQAAKMSEWARLKTGGNAAALGAGYTLAGSALPGTGYFSTAFAGPMAVAAMTGTSQTWLNNLYASIRVNRQGYYEDTINLLSLLVVTGNWWDPKN